MLLQAQLMIAEDSVKLGFHKAILAQLLATPGTGVLTDLDQGRLLCQERILYLRQKGDLLLMPKP